MSMSNQMKKSPALWATPLKGDLLGYGSNLHNETLRSSGKQAETVIFSVCFPEERRVSLFQLAHWFTCCTMTFLKSDEPHPPLKGGARRAGDCCNEKLTWICI